MQVITFSDAKSITKQFILKDIFPLNIVEICLALAQQNFPFRTLERYLPTYLPYHNLPNNQCFANKSLHAPHNLLPLPIPRIFFFSKLTMSQLEIHYSNKPSRIQDRSLICFLPSHRVVVFPYYHWLTPRNRSSATRSYSSVRCGVLSSSLVKDLPSIPSTGGLGKSVSSTPIRRGAFFSVRALIMLSFLFRLDPPPPGMQPLDRNPPSSSTSSSSSQPPCMMDSKHADSRLVAFFCWVLRHLLSISLCACWHRCSSRSRAFSAVELKHTLKMTSTKDGKCRGIS